MKKGIILIIGVLFTCILFLPNVFAQGSTRFRLPHGATARLGKGWIKDLQFSPNRAQLAVATTIGIWIYDVTTGEERNLLRGVMGGANAITYSPDGRILAAAHEDRTVYLWDNVTGSKHAFVGHTGDIRAIAFSKDGGLVASGGRDKTIRVWDVHAKKLRGILPGYDSTVSTLTFSSDSSMLAGGSENGPILVWDTGTSKQIHSFDRHIGLVSGLIFLDDDRILISSSLDGTIQLWDLVAPGGNISPPQQHRVPVYAVAFAPNSASPDTGVRTFASGSTDKLIRIWRTETDRLVDMLKRDPDLVFDDHNDSVRKVRLSPDGRTLASASLDGTVRIWDTALKRHRFTIPAHTGTVKALAYTADHRIYACGTGLDGKLRLWDAGTGVVLSVMQEHTGLTETAAFSWDGKTLASAGRKDGKIFLSDVETALGNDGSWSNSSLQKTLVGNDHGITALAFSPAGTTLASGGLDGKIHLLDITTRQKLEEFRGPESTVTALRFAIDGTFLASGEENSTLRYWDSLTGEEVKEFRLKSRAIGALAFSPATRFLAIGDAIGEIWLYDFKTGNESIIFTQHTRKITALVFSKDGRTLVSGSEDGTILLWDMKKQLP